MELDDIIDRGIQIENCGGNNTKLQSLESLKGPIVLQTLVQYSFFLLVIGTAERAAWSPNIRVANFLPYCIICIILLEANRLQKKPLMRIIFLLYSSNIPFCYMVIFSREAHILVALLFFVSCLCIFLQSGIPQLRKHILIFIAIVMVNYTACLLFMDWFYVDETGKNPYRGKTLQSKIHWGQESTILLSMALLGTSFIVLEKFIKSYANCLLEQYNQIKHLQKEKEQLQNEIEFIQNHNKLDLGTPIDTVINIIRTLMNQNDHNENTKLQLYKVLSVLSSHKLYDPIHLEKSSHNDKEVFSWLESMINRDFNDKSAIQNLEISSPATTPSKLNLSKYLLLQADPDKIFENRIFELIKKNIENWDFPIFELGEISNGNPLFYASYYIFARHKIFQKFHINEMVFRKFITIIEAGYDSENSYHNSLHAADVLITLNHLIEKGLAKSLNDLDILSMLLAAIVHDYKHNGVSNSFHINTKSSLALKYNDTSILENHHLAQSFKVIYSPIPMNNGYTSNSSNTLNSSTMNINTSTSSNTSTSLSNSTTEMEDHYLLESLSDQQKKELRDTVIKLVLATDMAAHFDLVGKFKSKLSASGGMALNGTLDRKDKLLLMQIAMKASDISNPAKPFNIYKQWTDRITEEFYRQGDQERQLGIDVTPFMNRHKPAITKCQISFINLFVEPLYDILQTQYPVFEPYHTNTKTNLAIWESTDQSSQQQQQ
ncbi:cAMP-specific phosphodiesterase [Tieghemostelium lacteum]|uniref:Phosphodiesterase n=1 Tax=Tieghemostelium lacteum TaxID=361077 RepID=A0A151Z797_TIELA|nr:cAMP-specific phosphodiesterase [Tieghemostelium lacteum]|eukprot:KYQ89841.1 cAMP-specific phosphodiesterase [Tieghemostelium lacteum]